MLTDSMDTIGKILICADAYADAYPPLGDNYVWRCVSLASAWIRMGGRVDFAGNRLPVTLHRKLRALGCELIEIGDLRPPFSKSRVINDLLRNQQPDFLVLDGERIDQHFESHLQLWGTRLVLIENEDRQHVRQASGTAKIILRQSIESCVLGRIENEGQTLAMTSPKCEPPTDYRPPAAFIDSQSSRPFERCQTNIRSRDDLSETCLAELVVNAICDQGLGNPLSFNRSGLLGRTGAERIARRLAVQLFRLRAAGMDDVELLHRWRNDPEVRASCFQNESVSLESYRQWLSVKLSSSRTDIRMIEDRNSNSVGSRVLDCDQQSKRVELSIQIIPSLRGCGLGTAFIELACAELIATYPEYQIMTCIKSGNLMAQSAFQKAGFRKVASTTVNGQVGIELSYLPDKQGQRIDPTISNRREIEGNWRQAS